MPTIVKCICQNCGKVFEHNRPNRERKYCSQKCAKSDPKHQKNRGIAISKAKSGRTWDKIYGKKEADRKRHELSMKVTGRNNPFYGKRHSEETRQIISKNRKNKGLGRKLSDETKEKIRQKSIGRRMSEETKQKISKTKRGISITRAKVQRHYRTSKLEETFQQRHPDAIAKYAAYGHEWDFKWGKWLVEIDGKYWHGLDRDDNYTPAQLNSMHNDLKKEQAILQNGANLLRFKGTRGKLLDEEPYKIIDSGSRQYKTNEIIEINGHALTKEYLNSLTISEREMLVEPLKDILLKHDFPYYDEEEAIKKHWELLKKTSMKLDNDGCLYNNDSIGTNICRYFCKSFYFSTDKKKRPMPELWNEPVIIEKLIRNRLGIDYKEVFDIKLKTFIQAMRSMRISANVSIFKPRIAKWVYENYTNTGKLVYDFSAGFGGRLLGAATAGVKYVGVDPLTIPELKRMSSYFNFKNITLIQGCSENISFPKDYFDLAFSSPPYHNQEIYAKNEEQAYNKGYDYFMNVYWRRTLENILMSLKKDGYFLLNMDSRYKDMLSMAKRYFTLTDMIGLKTIKSHLNKASDKSSSSKVNEYIYVYRK